MSSDSLHRWLAERPYVVERLASVRGYRVLGVGSQ